MNRLNTAELRKKASAPAASLSSKRVSPREARVADKVQQKKAAQAQANKAARARRAKLDRRKHTKPKWKQEAEKKIFEEKERRRAQKMLETLAIAEAQEEAAITEARKRNGKYSMKSAKAQDHIGSAFVSPGKRAAKDSTNGAPGTFTKLKAQKMPASPEMPIAAQQQHQPVRVDKPITCAHQRLWRRPNQLPLLTPPTRLHSPILPAIYSYMPYPSFFSFFLFFLFFGMKQ